MTGSARSACRWPRARSVPTGPNGAAAGAARRRAAVSPRAGGTPARSSRGVDPDVPEVVAQVVQAVLPEGEHGELRPVRADAGARPSVRRDARVGRSERGPGIGQLARHGGGVLSRVAVGDSGLVL